MKISAFFLKSERTQRTDMLGPPTPVRYCSPFNETPPPPPPPPIPLLNERIFSMSTYNIESWDSLQ